MTSSIAICNLALSQLGQKRITNLLAPTNANEELCALHYPLLRDAVLEQAEWSFAIKRDILIGNVASVEKWGYAYKSPVPVKYLRILSVRDTPKERSYNPNFNWEKEENCILSDSKKIYIRAIQSISDTTKYSPMFMQALAARIAMELCIPLTENQKLYQQLQKTFINKVQSATTINSMQGKSKKFRTGHLLGSRQ